MMVKTEITSRKIRIFENWWMLYTFKFTAYTTHINHKFKIDTESDWSKKKLRGNFSFEDLSISIPRWIDI